MGFLDGLGSIVSKVAHTGLAILKVALPIIESLRGVSKEVDDGLKYVEDKIDEGGKVADDWLDKNIDAILKLEKWSGRGAGILMKINALTSELRVISQEETPETVTPEEAKRVGLMILELKDMVKDFDADTEDMHAAALATLAKDA